MADKRNPDSGVGRQGGDPRPGGSTSGAVRHDTSIDDLQAIEGTGDDDLGAASDSGMWREGARSTPPMGDARSDDRGVANGEPR